MFNWVKNIFKPINKGLDIASEAVLDKDKFMELSRGKDLKEIAAFIEVAKIPTIPWIDGLYKMGRQIQGYLIIGLGFYCAVTGNDLSPNGWLVIGGVCSVYSVGKSWQKTEKEKRS